VTEPRRLFLALWPAPALARSITAAIAGVARNRGIAVPAAQAHLTLLFLGPVAAAAEARLTEAAAAIRVPRFELVLDQVGCFYRSRVLWAGPQYIPPPLLDLWEQLRGAAESAGAGQDYKPLVPHVTGLRDIRDRIRPVPIAPLRWAVADFALVHSADQQYHVVSQWPLQNAPK
jgi:2'-5' RNA ligase